MTSRRLFLNKLLTGVGFALPFFGAHKLLNGEKSGYPVNTIQKEPAGTRIIRPPGAVKEELFLAGCIRCYRCQDACEDGAIQFFTESSGRHYHTPYIDPSIKACTLCMKCTKVCPTNVLQPLEEEDLQKVRMGSIALYRDRCLAHKAKYIRNEQRMLMNLGRSYKETGVIYERRGPCGECHMFCPVREKAITLEPGSLLAPVIHEKHCVGCGLCEEICRQVVRGTPAIVVVALRDRGAL